MVQTETDGVMDLICVKPATALVDFNFEDTFYRRVVLNVLSNGQNAAIWLPGSFLKNHRHADQSTSAIPWEQ